MKMNSLQSNTLDFLATESILRAVLVLPDQNEHELLLKIMGKCLKPIFKEIPTDQELLQEIEARLLHLIRLGKNAVASFPATRRQQIYDNDQAFNSFLTEFRDKIRTGLLDTTFSHEPPTKKRTPRA